MVAPLTLSVPPRRGPTLSMMGLGSARALPTTSSRQSSPTGSLGLSRVPETGTSRAKWGHISCSLSRSHPAGRLDDYHLASRPQSAIPATRVGGDRTGTDYEPHRRAWDTSP